MGCSPRRHIIISFFAAGRPAGYCCGILKYSHYYNIVMIIALAFISSSHYAPQRSLFLYSLAHGAVYASVISLSVRLCTRSCSYALMVIMVSAAAAAALLLHTWLNVCTRGWIHRFLLPHSALRCIRRTTTQKNQRVRIFCVRCAKKSGPLNEGKSWFFVCNVRRRFFLSAFLIICGVSDFPLDFTNNICKQSQVKVWCPKDCVLLLDLNN